MTAPSTYLRVKREEATRRRLELAKMLRDDPKATNLALAKALGVNRDTIAGDRKVIMEELKKTTMDETTFYRAKLLTKLEALLEELERRRTTGKFSLVAVDREIVLLKEIKDLMGVKKPVVEKHEVKHTTISFKTSLVGNGKAQEVGTFSLCRSQPPFADAEVVKEPLTLEAGDEQS